MYIHSYIFWAVHPNRAAKFGLKAARFILALNGHVSILNIHVRCRLKTTGHLSLSMSQWGSEESHVGYIIFMC